MQISISKAIYFMNSYPGIQKHKKYQSPKCFNYNKFPQVNYANIFGICK